MAVASAIGAIPVIRAVFRTTLIRARVALPSLRAVTLELVRAHAMPTAEAILADTHTLGTGFAGPSLLTIAGAVNASPMTRAALLTAANGARVSDPSPLAKARALDANAIGGAVVRAQSRVAVDSDEPLVTSAELVFLIALPVARALVGAHLLFTAFACPALVTFAQFGPNALAVHVTRTWAIAHVAVHASVRDLAEALSILTAHAMASAIAWACLRSARRSRVHLALEIGLCHSDFSAFAHVLICAFPVFRAAQRTEAL